MVKSWAHRGGLAFALGFWEVTCGGPDKSVLTRVQGQSTQRLRASLWWAPGPQGLPWSELLCTCHHT